METGIENVQSIDNLLWHWLLVTHVRNSQPCVQNKKSQGDKWRQWK